MGLEVEVEGGGCGSRRATEISEGHKKRSLMALSTSMPKGPDHYKMKQKNQNHQDLFDTYDFVWRLHQEGGGMYAMYSSRPETQGREGKCEERGEGKRELADGQHLNSPRGSS